MIDRKTLRGGAPLREEEEGGSCSCVLINSRSVLGVYTAALNSASKRYQRSSEAVGIQVSVQETSNL